MSELILTFQILFTLRALILIWCAITTLIFKHKIHKLVSEAEMAEKAKDDQIFDVIQEFRAWTAHG